MNKKIVISILFLSLFYGCAAHKSKVENSQNDSHSNIKITFQKGKFENDPNFSRPNGIRVFIRTLNISKIKDISIQRKLFRDESGKWLTSRGFKIVNEARMADMILTIGLSQEADEENSSTLGVGISIASQIYGRPPANVSSGVITSEKQNLEIFLNKQLAEKVIVELLNDSVLGSIENAPDITVSGKDPGCWPRIGIKTDQEIKLEKGERISAFDVDSLAEKAGLRKGDIVLSINGQSLPDPHDEEMYLKPDKKVSVLATRDGEDFLIKVFPVIQCEGDEFND